MTAKKTTPSKRSAPNKQEKEAAERVATEQIHKLIPDPMINHLSGRMQAVMRSRGSDCPTESEKGFGTYAFGAMRPQNTAEVLLCSQMVATWETGMAMLTGARQADNFQSMTEQGHLAAKLLSIFERQFATLTKARRPPQVVTVVHEHKHVHVSTPGPTGDEIRIEGQPYGTLDTRTLAIAPSPAMLGAPPEVACPLPSPCDAERPLPPSRRRISGRTKRPG
jgi:hypothetical protein